MRRSLERLGTDRLDLYQLHSVGKLGALDDVTAEGGTLEALVRAQLEPAQVTRERRVGPGEPQRHDLVVQGGGPQCGSSCRRALT